MTKRLRRSAARLPRAGSTTSKDAEAPRAEPGAAPRVQRRALLQMGAGIAVAAGCGGANEVTSALVVEPGGAVADAAAPPLDAGAARDTGAPYDPPPRPAPDAGAEPVDASSDADAAPPKELTPEELLASVDTIVVVMMENRSFDHYLGALKADAAYAQRLVVDGLTGTESNPDARGERVPVFRMTNFTPADPPHEWNECHAQWNEGRNDGFVVAHAGASEKEAMGFHDRSQIPFMYWLADNFTICDRYFASVMGPTWPNRYYLHAASSAGEKSNTPFRTSQLPTIWDRMKAKGLSAKNFYSGVVGWFAGGFPTKLVNGPLARLDDFFAAAKSGTLPRFSVVDPDFTSNDDHPSHDIRKVGSSRVDLQACKLEYSIVSPK